MQLADIKTTLRDFIADDLLDGETEVAFDDNLLADGMIDSVSVGRLVAYVDERFGYAIPVEDLTVERFRTVDALGAYLERRLNGGS